MGGRRWEVGGGGMRLGSGRDEGGGGRGGGR